MYRFIVTSVCAASFLLAFSAERANAEDLTRVVASEIVSYAADRAVARGRDLPLPTALIAYADTTDFDTALYSSLRNVGRERQPDVRVTLPEATQTANAPAALPERLRLWTSNIENRGGVVMRCAPASAAGLGGILGIIVREVLPTVLGLVRRWGLYRPTARVSAIIEIDPATDQATVIRFFPRNQLSTVRRTYGQCEI